MREKQHREGQYGDKHYTQQLTKKENKHPDESIDGCSGEHSLASIKSKIISFSIILPGDDTTVESVTVRAMKTLFFQAVR